MTLRAALRVLCAVVSIFFLTTMARAQDATLLQQFDKNANGVIDPEEATPSFLNYFNQIVLPGLHVQPEPSEPDGAIVAAQSVVPDTSADQLVISDEVMEDAPNVTTASAIPGDISADVAPNYTHAFLLRGDATDSSIMADTASLESVSGAFVSYSNDVRQSTEEWQVKGAILYPVRFDKGTKDEMNGTRLTAYTFVPSVAFDRKFDSQDVTSELDTLKFEIGSEWEFSAGGWFEKQYVRMGPFYATDFAFESAVAGVEMEYEPLSKKWGLGEARDCFARQFSCEWHAKLALSAGQTLDAGDKVNLLEDEDFITFGPKISLALAPTFKPFDRLKLDASWYYIEDILGDTGAADQLEAGISFGLDESGHIRLRTEYRHGDLEYTRDKITIVTTGLEVKF